MSLDSSGFTLQQMRDGSGLNHDQIASILGITRDALYKMMRAQRDVRFVNHGQKWEVYEIKRLK